MKPTKLLSALACAGAMVVAGCQAPAAVSAAKPKIERSAGTIIGNRLVGARGRTPSDQEKIDDTVTRICAARVWSKSDCLRHDALTQGSPQ